jgi:magnesium chelatase subunit D
MKTDRSSQKQSTGMRAGRAVYPFAAIVGQSEMKLGLLLNVIDPGVGGVLIMGHRGTGKSTAARSLTDLLPQAARVRGCFYGCDPKDVENLCRDCRERFTRGEKLHQERATVPVVDLPLGATEDRICGTINIERALTEGVKAFEPGLLARANRGFLYIDEVNLLEDHLVDLLLDTAAAGRNVVEREGISVEHPSRFVLIGSGNPEEGELRPQLLDRFGLHVEIKTIESLDERLLIMERREEFERDAKAFEAAWEAEQETLRRRITRARKIFKEVRIERALLRRVAELCHALKVDGHRGELTITRAARALAALEGRRRVTAEDIERVAVMSLRHRLRRDPLDQTPGGARIEQALENLFPDAADKGSTGRKDLSDDFEPDDFQGSKRGDGSQGNGGRQKSGKEQSAPAEAGPVLPGHNFELPRASVPRNPSASSTASQSRQSRTKASYNTRRGRYVRATPHRTDGSKLALDATLRAMLCLKSRAPADALRFKLYKRKTGVLFIFAIDTSGSMALNRIRQAKGTLLHLLERSYIRRDQVALVSFRGEGAEVLLYPSQSVARARTLLDRLPMGGATPLASGLAASLQLARHCASRTERQIVLLLFTDGRANIPMRPGHPADKARRRQQIQQELKELGTAFESLKVLTVVVDTQTGYTANGEGRALAEALNARYIFLPAMGRGVEADSFNLALQRLPTNR